jgi:lipid II:glycine glycyltransferase (peptidoglycan interpeptide bridge formation enzyme)
VSETALGSYLQLSPWAAVKAANGWSSVRVAAEVGRDRRVGVQVLLRRPRPMPWSFAYAARGPVADTWTADTVETLTERLRTALRPAGRVSHLRIDPEIERDGPRDPEGALRSSLRHAGWRPAAPIQPGSTRVIDLASDEEALWGELRKKWRQYVNKARANGVRVVDGDRSRLGEFYEIYRETAARAGFLIRTEATYRTTWDAFAPAGLARLLFAETADGTPVATLFLLRCGSRVVEPYGGMTAAGAETRANYLLKWEAIRSSRERGAATYDLWGLAHPGIAHFKAGFGGREVHYVGAWDLVLDPAGRLAYDAGQRARVWVARRRHGLSASGSAAEFDGTGGAA